MGVMRDAWCVVRGASAMGAWTLSSSSAGAEQAFWTLNAAPWTSDPWASAPGSWLPTLDFGFISSSWVSQVANRLSHPVVLDLDDFLVGLEAAHDADEVGHLDTDEVLAVSRQP